jgi:PAS domain S-box-containing protein
MAYAVQKQADPMAETRSKRLLNSLIVEPSIWNWLPVTCFACAAFVLALLQIESTWNSSFLLLALNTTFLCAISLVISAFAAHSYFAGQGTSVLLLGCGTLALGLGAIISGLPPAGNDPNYTVTVYNMTALLASAFHVAGAAWARWRKQHKARPRGYMLMLLYPAVIMLVMFGTAVARQRKLPVFFVDGAGATGLDKAVLWTASGLFFFASGLLWKNYRQNRTAFSRWYASGLCLLVVGLLAVSFQQHLGSPLNWTGRAAQYVGGVYMLIAVISAGARDRGWTVSLEAALREAEERYRLLVEMSPDPIIVSRNERIVFSNPAANRLFGVPSDKDLFDRPLADFFQPDSCPKFIEGQPESGKCGITPVTEGQIRRFDGVVRDVEIVAAPVDDTDGGLIQIVMRDNTERKIALEALRQSEHRYQVLSEATVEGICVSEYGCIIDANEQLAKLLGYSRDELIGKEVRLLLPEHEQDRVMENIRHNLESKIEHETIRSDGQVLTVEAHARTLRYHGRTVRLTTIHDVTERKRTEVALQRIADELKRSNQDLEQFAYAASHDLQEPLRMINGFLQLLKERYGANLDQKAKEYIEFAVDGSNRMHQLIRDLLEFSRVERKGRILQPTDANQALKAAIANLNKSILEANAMVTADELPVVLGDAVQLSQLFQNLIGNALKFRSAEQACRVHISARRLGAHWRFSVYDNGIGIDPGDRDRIFVIFQRLHSRSQYPGTGIGLALCKRIVERHGGHIWVESKETGGSVFHFTLIPAALA